MARPIAFPRLGVNMAAIGVDMAVVGVLQCCSSNEVDKPMELNFLRLVITSITCFSTTAPGQPVRDSGAIIELDFHQPI